MEIQPTAIFRFELLRCSSRSLGAVPRPIYWAAKRQRSVLRFASSQPPRSHILEQRCADSCPKCWSLLSSSSLAISSQLSSWGPRRSKVNREETPLLVILVTPAHLSLLEDGGVFIPRLLRQEGGNPQPGRIFDVVAAVVDRISHPGIATEWDEIIEENSPSNVALGSIGRDGSEGISVAVLDSNSAAPSLWSKRQELKEGDMMTIQQKCTLTFTLPPAKYADRDPQNSTPQSLASRMLQLPVANTIFQNGRAATLFAQRWTVQQENDSNVRLTPSQKIWLPRQALDLNSLVEEKTYVDQSLRSHLVPITPPRIITAAIGNIIRKVSSSDSLEADCPASEELERAINSNIKNESIPDQPAGVWALVRPRELVALEDSHIGEMRPMLGQLHKAILSGCRLHKVLSGGGGWGEKRGLLALDPDYDYNPRHQAFQSSFGDEQDVQAEKVQALGEMVKPGDTVTFYVRDPSLAPADAIDSQPHSVACNNFPSLSLMFGSVLSTMDTMPDPRGTGKSTSKDHKSLFLEGCFGMLSEQGMSLTSTFSTSDIKEVTTKLDAPYTSFIARAKSWAPQAKKANGLDVRSRDEDHQERTKTKLKATSSANARINTVNLKTRKIDVRIFNTQSLPRLSPNISKLGGVQSRAFTTDRRCCSQLGSDHSPEAEAEADSLAQQLRNLQIPAFTIDDADDVSSHLAKKIARLRTKMRGSQLSPAINPESEAQASRKGRKRSRKYTSKERATRMQRPPIRKITGVHLRKYTKVYFRKYPGNIPNGPLRHSTSAAADDKRLAKVSVEAQTHPRARRYFRKSWSTQHGAMQNIQEKSLIRKHVSDLVVQDQPLIRKYGLDLSVQEKPLIRRHLTFQDEPLFRKPVSDQIVQEKPSVRDHSSNANALRKYKKLKQNSPPPVQILIQKYKRAKNREVNAKSAEQEASESQLQTRKASNKSHATDIISSIRFISNMRNEDTRAEVSSEPKSELSERNIEHNRELIEYRQLESKSELPEYSIGQDPEQIEIHRHMSVGKAPKPPIAVSRIRRVPGSGISKHAAAEKVAINPEGQLFIRKHSISDRHKRDQDQSPVLSPPHVKEVKLKSPKDKAKELHSKYNMTSIHDIPPQKVQNPH